MIPPLGGGKSIFAALLAIEAALIWAVRSRRRPLAPAARLLVILVPLALVLALRGWQAFGVRGILDWDETYYVSLATTAAAGRGLYPYIFGYGPMPIMGGIGYAAYLYAFAVRIFGPTIVALRGVSFAWSLIGLAGMWMLVRRWYGTGTAWMAAALTASLRLFIQSNTARMDAAAFAWVAWALYAAAVAWDRPADRWRHYAAGLVFGLGLEVHIDTAVTAMACCAVYVAPWIRGRFQSRVQPLLLFIAGELTGVAVFVCANILPNPQAFYRTTVLTRVDATTWYSTGTSSLAGSFLNPAILIAKESARYRALWHSLPAAGMLIAALAIVAAACRKTAADRIVLTLIPAVLIATAVVLNNAAPLYFIHVLPALVVPIAPLFTLGFTGRRAVATPALTSTSLAAFAAAASVLVAVSQPAVIRSITRAEPESAVDHAIAAGVYAVVDRRCTIAGDGGLYVRYFAGYPFFISTRATDVAYGMMYYSLPSEYAYWAVKQPDVVLATDRLPPALAWYVSRGRLEERAPGVWMRRGGCRGDGGR